ncbi:molybdopterin-dependent oxidoreductase [soil metagenome]
MKYIGKEMNRVDGVAKVTGAAKYAVEFAANNVAYGFIVQSEIAKGAIKSIDTTKAEKQSGVIKVFTHLNAPKLSFTDKKDADEMSPEGEPFRALYTDKIMFSGQPIALVVAETYEQARFAAHLVKAAYTTEKSATETTELLKNAYVTPPEDPKNPVKFRGNPTAALKSAPVKIEAEYTIPIEHHNPMEMHGAIAAWEGDKLTIFDKSQYVYNVRNHLASIFGIAPENVSVISSFVGGAFGSSLRPNYYPLLAAMSSREVKRPFKISFTRRQMFTGHGYRPYTWQKVRLGAEKNGKLTAIIHESVNNTSSFEDYADYTTEFTKTIYACPNLQVTTKVTKTDLPTPFAMRAPGAVSGMFALESALDELAYKLKIDPLEIRLINYAETDPDSGKPWSSKALRECYKEAGDKFGWKKRNPEPRSQRDGKWLVGWGMATGTWGAFQNAATVRIALNANGTAHVSSATSDIGPGTYTVITMIAAEFLGLPPEKVKFELGDTKFPKAPAQGGSWTTASVGSATKSAADAIIKKLLTFAEKENPEFKAATPENVRIENGKILFQNKFKSVGILVSVKISELFRKNNLTEIVEVYEGKPSPERDKYALQAHGAQFVEVKVDEDLGIVKVTRVVEATACGKIMNPKAAHSQEMGGVVWGIGMALHENTEIDHRYGRMMTTNLADYHIPSNADVHEVETYFVEEEDKIVNELGVKGMGELGMVGIPAAIANAVFHATGKRIRDLPITLDKLL